jgi:hypothetical protein
MTVPVKFVVLSQLVAPMVVVLFGVTIPLEFGRVTFEYVAFSSVAFAGAAGNQKALGTIAINPIASDVLKIRARRRRTRKCRYISATPIHYLYRA